MSLHALLLVPAALLNGSAGDSDDWSEQRRAMVREVAAMAREVREELGRDRLDARVLEALGRVPRHELVPAAARRNAYRNHPLPIGHGQTISQPFIVALMTDLVGPQPDERVLEIGTGSGYQAAVLAELADAVYTIEIVPELGRSAARNLKRLGYQNISTRIGDGHLGWPEAAPFDAIVVTAAGEIPSALVEQLAAGGRMVVPVGPPDRVQHLTLIRKSADGTLDQERVLPVAFVPLVREDS